MRMSRLLLAGLIYLGGCADQSDDLSPVDTDTDVVIDETGSPDTGETAAPAPDPCLTPAPLPLPYSTLKGFSSAEDFDFDGVGNLVSVDWSNNLFGEDLSGNTTIISPNVVSSAAGTRILPNGDWVVCDACLEWTTS